METAGAPGVDASPSARSDLKARVLHARAWNICSQNCSPASGFLCALQ